MLETNYWVAINIILVVKQWSFKLGTVGSFMHVFIENVK